METFVNVICWILIVLIFISKPYFDALIERNDGIYQKEGVDTARALIFILVVATLCYNSCG